MAPSSAPPPIRRVLCPVDFSAPSDHALGVAVRVATRLGAELHLLHVYQLPIFVDPDGAPFADGRFAELRERLGDEARAALERRARARDLTLHEHLAEGPPADEIVGQARALDADLLVMGTHGRTGLERLLLGSVAERVVRTSPAPVLTVPHDPDGLPHEPLAEVRRVSFPTDFSEASLAALPFARRLAEGLGARHLELVHVFEVPVTFVSDAGPLIDVENLKALRAHHERALKDLAATQAGGGLEVSGRMLEGVDYATLVQDLERGPGQATDLVVMATRGRGRVAHLLLGSVAERVVRTSPTPVCTVRIPPNGD